MIHERARVLDSFAGGAWVRAESQAGCARCAAGEGCGSATLGRLLGDRLTRIEVTSATPLQAGALVEIGIDERAVSLAATVVYGLPLALLLGGAALGTLATGTAVGADVAAAAGAVLGLLAGTLGARRIARSLAPRALRPRVLRALAADERCAG